MVRCEAAPLSDEWGYGSPSGANLNADHFSARWTGTFDFNVGSYDFSGWTDDGMRVYVGSVLQLNSWTHPQSHAVNWQQTFASSGPREVRIEYYENDGWARAELNWVLQQPAQDVGLVSGVSVVGPDIDYGAWKYYYITVPAAASQLSVVTTGIGDADLFSNPATKPIPGSSACASTSSTAEQS